MKNLKMNDVLTAVEDRKFAAHRHDMLRRLIRIAATVNFAGGSDNAHVVRVKGCEQSANFKNITCFIHDPHTRTHSLGPTIQKSMLYIICTFYELSASVRSRENNTDCSGKTFFELSLVVNNRRHKSNKSDSPEYLMEISVNESSFWRSRVATISEKLSAMESVLATRGLSRQVKNHWT